jgi:hypothetical protein
MSQEIIPNEVFPVREVDDQAEFDADLAYLYGLSEALFAYAAPEDLLHIAAFDRGRS